MTEPIRLNRKVQQKSIWDILKFATNHYYDRILRALFITLLFVLDFVMFVYSINGRLWEEGVFNEAMLNIFGGFFSISLIIMFLLSFSGMAQNIFCGIFVLLITIIFLNQFALFDVDTFIERWLDEHASFISFLGFLPSSWITGLFLGALVFLSFRYTLMIAVISMALAGSIAIGVYRTELAVAAVGEYRTVQEVETVQNSGQEHNLIYIMLPKFPSYHFLSTVKDINFRELRDMMVGFYAVNSFEIYPNAFVQKDDAISNIVDIYNQVNYGSTSSGIRGYAAILNDWDFVHGALDDVSLEENKLYDYLGQKGYKISTYAMPQFNLCYKNGNINTDRCVLKQYDSVKLYDKKSSLEKNIYALLGEWVMSMRSKELKSVAKMLIDMSPLKGLKILSENRRLSIEGTPMIFNKLYEDFEYDRKGFAYMSFVELPSDLYIYDEFCKLKPRKEWISLKDNSLYSTNIDEKRRAYVEQTKCLIGMMQIYLENIYKNEKIANTDVIIQGVSPVRELAGMVTGDYGNFVANKLVSLGIRRGNNASFLVNTDICLASDITKSHILGEKFCYSLDAMKMRTDEMLNLEHNLVNNSIIRGNKISTIATNYRDWYAEFRKRNGQYLVAQKKVIPQILTNTMPLGDEENSENNTEAEAMPVSEEAVSDASVVMEPQENAPENEGPEVSLEADESLAQEEAMSEENQESGAPEVAEENEASEQEESLEQAE